MEHLNAVMGGAFTGLYIACVIWAVGMIILESAIKYIRREHGRYNGFAKSLEEISTKFSGFELLRTTVFIIFCVVVFITTVVWITSMFVTEQPPVGILLIPFAIPYLIFKAIWGIMLVVLAVIGAFMYCKRWLDKKANQYR